MEDVLIELEPREVTGKAVKHLRQEGSIPAVIHDHGKPSLVVMGDFIQLNKAYAQAGKHHPVKIKVGDKHYTALIKNVDVDPKKHLLRHVVFNAVKANEKVTTEVPVHLKFDEGNDTTPAERNGLIVLRNIDTVEIEATPSNLPDSLEVDGEKLVEIGDHLTVADIIVPEGVEVKEEPTQTLATVFEPSALQAANDAAGGTAEEETAEEASGEGEQSESTEAEKSESTESESK